MGGDQEGHPPGFQYRDVFRFETLFPHGKEDETEKASLSSEEARLFLDRVEEHECIEYFALFAAAIHVGWRYNQLAGMTWDDVTWEEGTAMLRLPAHRSKKKGKAVYTYAHGRLYKALCALRDKRGAHPNAHVFVTLRGKALHRSSCGANRILRRILKHCPEIPRHIREGYPERRNSRLSFHGMRSTSRNVAIDMDISEALIDAMGDWTTPKGYAGRQYQQRIEAAANRAAMRIADALESKPPKSASKKVTQANLAS